MAAEPVRDAESTRVFVEHEVMFMLADADRFVVRRRHAQGYVSVGYITVHLHHDQRVHITASGSICKKDGTPSAVTSMNESVDLPDEAHWVERAKAALIDGSNPPSASVGGSGRGGEEGSSQGSPDPAPACEHSDGEEGA